MQQKALRDAISSTGYGKTGDCCTGLEPLNVNAALNQQLPNLAAEPKQSVNKSGVNIFSMEVVREAEQM
jgi:hypothetical protein